ncbi:MAG: DUF2147 domain-containing protein [Bacteroidetes bacterium]|nr:MAG: DUF2147 domain-containing protein [Bacteroidota bacterium]
MQKLSFLISVILFIALNTFAQRADEIIGKYHLPNDLDVEIFEDGGKYFGKIIALNNFRGGQTKDVNNPDELKKKEPLIGKIIIKDLEYDTEEKQWLKGSMYGPEKGMVFNLKITEIREKEIEVVGSKFIMWRTLAWKKI